MDVIEGTGAIVPEPDWQSLFSDVLEMAAAKEHWRIVTTELKDKRACGFFPAVLDGASTARA